MNQERVNGLAQFAVEREISRSLEIRELVTTFTAQ
jgi:hypothetical protein